MSQKVLFGKKPWKFNPTNSTDNKSVTSNKIGATLSTETVKGKDKPMIPLVPMLPSVPHEELSNHNRVLTELESNRPNLQDTLTNRSSRLYKNFYKAIPRKDNS